MTHNAKAFDSRRDSSLRQASPQGQSDGGFKPVALPALAAAVHMTARTQPRKAAHRDIPAILREEALID
jgi:hypothetical protein